MEKKIRIGVIGCASIARKQIIPAIKSIPQQFLLSGIASRNFENAQLLGHYFQTQPFKSYDSLIDSGELDAVYIPLPNAMHAEWVDYALQKGIHVLVEKSLACSVLEVENLCSLARKNKLALVENFQFRFHRQLSRIKELLEDGEIGELRSLRSSFGFPPFTEPDNIRYQRSLGGGALFDAGAYTIKVTQEFLGSDLLVSGACLHENYEIGVDLWGGGFIHQRAGDLFSQISFGFDNFYQCELELWGSKGKLRANRIFTAPPGFSPDLIMETVDGTRSIKVPADNHFINMLLHFYRVIHNESLAEIEFSHNINQAKLIQQFRSLANAQ